MAGHPDAAVLVEAVQALLTELAGELPAARGFEARVAAGALGIVARELRGGGEDALAGAGVICAQLRDGTLEPNAPGLLDALTRATLAQLRIDNPRYATLARLEDR